MRIGSAMQSITLAVPVRISTAGHAALAVGPLEQPLADDAAQGGDEGLARLAPARSAGKRSTRRVIVSATPTARIVEITRWPTSAAVSAARRRLGVEQLADEDDVGVLAEAAAQRGGVARGVAADLALGDDRLLVGVEHLDRVLDGDDVAAALAVDPVDHRGDRGGLARAGRPGDEHQAALLLGEALHLRGQAELVEVGDLRRDPAHDHGERAALAVDGDPEAAEAGDAEPGAGLTGGGELVLAGGVEDARGERLHDTGAGRLERGGLELAVDAHVGHGARLEVQVGAPDLVQVRQELFQLGHTAYIGPRGRGVL